MKPSRQLTIEEWCEELLEIPILVPTLDVLEEINHIWKGIEQRITFLKSSWTDRQATTFDNKVQRETHVIPLDYRRESGQKQRRLLRSPKEARETLINHKIRRAIEKNHARIMGILTAIKDIEIRKLPHINDTFSLHLSEGESGGE